MRGKSDHYFIDANMKNIKYIKVLKYFLLSFLYCSYRTKTKDFLFMKENAAFHFARY